MSIINRQYVYVLLSTCTLHVPPCAPNQPRLSTRPGSHTCLRATNSVQLETLPEELLQLIVRYLPTADLKNAALASSTLNRHVTDLLWRNVCLVDQWTLHPDDNPEPLIKRTRGHGRSDEHDDTPIIRKLFVLATYALHNPHISHILIPLEILG